VSGLKAYVSVDLEGLPGVVSGTMLSPWSSQFSRASKIVTKIINAVADELFKSGFSEVVVADSHGLMTNIEYTELDGRVAVIQGYPRPLSMITALDGGFSAVFYVGYHTAAGTTHGAFDHTYSGRAFAEIRINGVRVSEYIINSLCAGEYSVPVAYLAGDDYLKDEVEKYTPWVVFTPLKRGVSRYAAFYYGLDRVMEAVRRDVNTAASRVKRGEVRVLSWSKPLRVELTLRDSLIADVLEEKFKRVDAYTVYFEAESAIEALATIELVAMVAYGVDSFKSALK
jgi:D-amino peptidase